MADTTDLIARLRDCAALSPRDKDRHEAADALEAQAREIALMDAAYNKEISRRVDLESRLAAAECERDEAHSLWAMDRKRLAEAESRLNLAEAEVTMLRHFNAEAERDAARYRRLRVDPSLVVGPSYVLRRTDELDAAIDAAKEGEK